MTRRILVSIVAAAAAIAQTPQGQMPQSFAGIVKLNRAPVSNEVLKVKLPRPVERQLSNGLKLLVVESHRVPTIALRITIPTGELRDSDETRGVSGATAALMRLGTKTRSAKDIADQIAELGATLNIGAGQGEGTISISSLTENFDATLALMTDILLNPSFPQDELDKWKARQRAQLEQAKSNPGFLAQDVMMKLLYPDDARRYTHPTPESLNKITREAIIEHYKKYYVPSGEWAGIAGDINPRDAVAKLEKALGAWKGGPVAPLPMKFPEPMTEKKVLFIPRPNSVQTLLYVTNHAIDRKSPDYFDCQVMNRVLGGGPSSRLFRIIREEKGYTYGISSGFSATRFVNHFVAATSVRTEVTEPALTELLAQFADIRNRAVPTDELADAKSAIVASFVLGLESSQAVLGRWMEQRMDGLPEDYWDTYTNKVTAISAEDVQRVAKKYVPLDNIRIIAVGDPKIGELLKKFGPVEEISPDTI
jgi:predicted Zn-dependent peptidase